MFNISCGFQEPNTTLGLKLTKILQSKEKGLLVGLNIPYKIKDLKKLKNQNKYYWIQFLKKYKFMISKLINKNNVYYSAVFTRFYIRYKYKDNLSKKIEHIKKIWEKKHILIIEGERTRLGIGNDLFDNAKSIKRIICPFKNAFTIYNKIIKNIVNLKEKKRLIIISLGPTATILAYDLYKLGYQCIDIGHIDLEYEWYLRKAKTTIPIENKFCNEVGGEEYIFNNTNYFNKIYQSQIIAKITN